VYEISTVSYIYRNTTVGRDTVIHDSLLMLEFCSRALYASSMETILDA